MAIFELLIGQFEQADKNAKPVEMKDPSTGHVISARQPTKKYSAVNGPVEVESDVDLVAKYGPEKFRLKSGTPKHGAVKGMTVFTTPGDPTAQNLEHGAVAPGGQVSTGFQQATSDGGSAVLHPDKAAEMAERHAGRTAEETGRAQQAQPQAQPQPPTKQQDQGKRR